MQGLLDLMSIEKLSAWGLVKLWKPLATRPCMHFLVNVAFNAVGQSSTSTHLAMVWGSIHALQTDPAHNWPTETPEKKPDTLNQCPSIPGLLVMNSGSLWRYDKPWGFFWYVQTPSVSVIKKRLTKKIHCECDQTPMKWEVDLRKDRIPFGFLETIFPRWSVR